MSEKFVLNYNGGKKAITLCSCQKESSAAAVDAAFLCANKAFCVHENILR